MGDTTRTHLGGLKTWSIEVDLLQDYASSSTDQTLNALVGKYLRVRDPAHVRQRVGHEPEVDGHRARQGLPADRRDGGRTPHDPADAGKCVGADSRDVVTAAGLGRHEVTHGTTDQGGAAAARRPPTQDREAARDGRRSARAGADRCPARPVRRRQRGAARQAPIDELRQHARAWWCSASSTTTASASSRTATPRPWGTRRPPTSTSCSTPSVNCPACRRRTSKSWKALAGRPARLRLPHRPRHRRLHRRRVPRTSQRPRISGVVKPYQLEAKYRELVQEKVDPEVAFGMVYGE